MTVWKATDIHKLKEPTTWTEPGVAIKTTVNKTSSLTSSLKTYCRYSMNVDLFSFAFWSWGFWGMRGEKTNIHKLWGKTPRMHFLYAWKQEWRGILRLEKKKICNTVMQSFTVSCVWTCYHLTTVSRKDQKRLCIYLHRNVSGASCTL